MRVTILVANYNYGHYLADALDSCLNQTYPCNIAFIDDASTDNSWEVACKKIFGECRPKEVQRKDGHILIPLLKNSKQAAARNFGIQAAWNYTDAFAILDADDMMLPNKIKKCVEQLQKSKHIGLVYADYLIENVITGLKLYEYKEPYDYYRLQQECIVHSGSIFTKQALEFVYKQSGFFFDETMPPCEDWDLWLRIAEGFVITHIPEALTNVRVQSGSCTYTVSKEKWMEQWKKIRQKQYERHQLHSTNKNQK